MSTSIYIIIIHAGMIKQNQLSKPQSPIYQRLADMVAIGDDGGVEAVGKAFDLYRSCMDDTTIESLGAIPLLKLIQNTLGSYTYTESGVSEAYKSCSQIIFITNQSCG